MALTRCWRIASVVPRVLWRSAVLSDACSSRGQSWLSFVNNHTGCTRTRLTVRFSSTQPDTDVSYEELKQIVDGQKAVIIDVREPWELREYGSIPGSINVPRLHTIWYCSRRKRPKRGGTPTDMTNKEMLRIVVVGKPKPRLLTAILPQTNQREQYKMDFLGQINTALQLDAEEFEEKFGGQMPQQTDSIVFMCLAGVRSKTALDAATSLGYKRVQHYPGGWQEWATNEQK